MNPLQSELHRLYHLPPDGASGERVRAMVVELVAPPSWRVLGHVWQGVQDAWGLPAPGIAVSGTDGLQLWFSLAEPVTATQARAFLDGLRKRFLTDVATERIRLHAGPAAPVPSLQEATGNWSAFVAPDLAPVFDDTPWLDIAPNEEGQASLLRALRETPAAAFAAALRSLQPSLAAPSAVPQGARAAPAPGVGDGQAEGQGEGDPRGFLLRVMNDETVALALRIEAAKALLPAR